MNCGFEDIRVLMELIDKNNGEVSESFKQYSVLRAEDLQTISKLALDNYHEMSSKVTNVWYLFRKKIDNMLGRYGNGLFQWIPLYTMISFRGDIPYSKAIKIDKRQTKILNAIEVGTVT
jgi:kynurenine 3-monooxygenase